MLEFVDTYMNVDEQEFGVLPNIEKQTKEELVEDFQDLSKPTIKVSDSFEPIKIPKFLKEVRVSLSRLSESEILKYTQRITKENADDNIDSKSNEGNKCEMCGLFLASEKLLEMHKVIVHNKTISKSFQYIS